MKTGVRITGIVVDSRKYSTRDGCAVHDLLLQQKPPGLPTLARREFGADPASHLVAERLARTYRPGQGATVTAHGWAVDAQRGLLLLREVDHCEPLPTEQPLQA